MLRKLTAAAAAVFTILAACSAYAADAKAPAQALGDVTDSGLVYMTVDGGTAVSITGYKGSDSRVEIPAVIDGRPVTEICEYAFSYNGRPTEIILPDTITYIGESAFKDCGRLASINIPHGVTSIEDDLFYHCAGLAGITLPDSILSIGKRAFSGCSALCEIEIPPRVSEIGISAFASCRRLTGIVIPRGVTSIPDGLCYGCSSLCSATIPDTVEDIGRYAFSSCMGLRNVRFPESVTSIGAGAFKECRNLGEVFFQDGLCSIGDSAFQSCTSLWELSIPRSVKSIGNEAFAYCSGLNLLWAGPAIDAVGNNAFAGVSLNTLDFDGSPGQWNSSLLKSVLKPEPQSIEYSASESVLPDVLPGSEWYISDSANGYELAGIEAGSKDSFVSAGDVLECLKAAEGMKLTVVNADGTPADVSEPVCTGMRINASGASQETTELVIVVRGDVIGQGLMSLSQVVRTAESFTGRYSLEWPYLAAGCLSGGDRVTLTDVVQIADMFRRLVMI